jgi:hypothetical protein
MDGTTSGKLPTYIFCRHNKTRIPAANAEDPPDAYILQKVRWIHWYILNSVTRWGEISPFRRIFLQLGAICLNKKIAQNSPQKPEIFPTFRL